MNPLIILVAGAALLMIAGAAIAILTGGNDNVEERLDQYVTSGTTFEIDEASEDYDHSPDVADRIDKAIEGRGFFGRIKARLAKADVRLRVSEYLVLQVVAIAVAAALGYFVLGGPVFAILGGVIGFFLPQNFVKSAANRRLRDFDSQLADTLNLWVNAMRSGYSVLQAMESIATEMPAPVSREFERVVQEVRLGLSLSQALGNMLRRVPSEDLDLVITAVDIQREVGGNLAEILEIISHTIRERVRIKREVRTLTAQVRASAVVVTALPFALGGILFLINPNYVGELFLREGPYVIPDVFPCGWLVIAIGLVMTFIGMTIISRIVDIEV